MTLSYCQLWWEGTRAGGLLKKNQAVHVRRENIEPPLSWHRLTGKRQHELCAYTYSVCEITGEGDGRAQNGIADCMGGTPKFKEAGAVFTPPNTHTHTRACTNTHHVTLSANCSLLFCISPSSCFLPHMFLKLSPCPVPSFCALTHICVHIDSH